MARRSCASGLVAAASNAARASLRSCSPPLRVEHAGAHDRGTHVGGVTADERLGAYHGRGRGRRCAAARWRGADAPRRWQPCGRRGQGQLVLADEAEGIALADQRRGVTAVALECGAEVAQGLVGELHAREVQLAEPGARLGAVGRGAHELGERAQDGLLVAQRAVGLEQLEQRLRALGGTAVGADLDQGGLEQRRPCGASPPWPPCPCGRPRPWTSRRGAACRGR